MVGFGRPPHLLGLRTQTASAHLVPLFMSSSNAPIPHLCAVAASRERRLLQQPSVWLHEELAVQMAARLKVLRSAPKHWLDWAPEWGGQHAAAAVGAVFPAARRWVHHPDRSASAPSAPWWRLGTSSSQWDGQRAVGMVWANMGLRSVLHPALIFGQWHQALEPGGLLMFSALGPHSLQALREVYAACGWGEAATPFVDMHDWGDQLLQAGYADPVMDTSFLDLTYSSAEAMLQDLRAMGRNTHDRRFAACRTPRWRQQLLEAIESDMPRDAQGRLVLSLEVIWGHAWRGLLAQAEPTTTISARDMRDMLRRNIRK